MRLSSSCYPHQVFSLCHRSVSAPLGCLFSAQPTSGQHHTRLGRSFQALECTATLPLVSLVPSTFTALLSVPFHLHYCDKIPFFFLVLHLCNMAFVYNLLHAKSRIPGVSLKCNTGYNPARGVTCWVRLLMRTLVVLACIPSEADHQGASSQMSLQGTGLNAF